MSADNTQETSQTDNPGETPDQSKGNDAIGTQLAALGDALRQINQRLDGTEAVLKETTSRFAPAREQEEENLYEPKQLLSKAQDAFKEQLRAEKAKDTMVWNLAQEYPEIQTDQKVRQAVIDAQKEVPESIRDTAAGYEHAILKAASRHGLVPKSKRQSIDDDGYMAPRSAPAAPKKKVKVSAEQIQIAELMGIDTSDPEYIKRLESANQRERWDKYR